MDLAFICIILCPTLAEDINKVKVKKAKPIQNNRHLVQPILLDNCGRPVFPIELGNLTVFYLGEVRFHGITDKPCNLSCKFIYKFKLQKCCPSVKIHWCRLK